MEEVYLINRETRIAKSPDRLSIIFRGNVSSIGPAIPFIFFFITILLAYGLYALDRLKPTAAVFALFLTSLISIITTVTELTLKYEIKINKSYLLLITSRLNVRFAEKFWMKEIIAIEKVMVTGQIGDSIIDRPCICIRKTSGKHLIPVTLDENNVDDIIKLMQEFIAGSNV
jgi:hypothetical protein